MELDVECKTYLQENGIIRLQIKTALKNVGLSRVTIDGKSSALRIHRVSELQHADLMPDNALESEWYRVGTFSLFSEHGWIEPSEIVQDQKMIECKSNYPVFKIEAFVMTETLQWYSACISAKDLDDEQHEIVR